MNLFHLYCRLEFFFLRLCKIIKFKSFWKNSIVKYWLFGWSQEAEIWENVYIWEGIHMWAEWWLSIWDGTIIWPRVTIRTTNHDYKSWDFLPYGPWVEKRKVEIWKNCWIWEGVYINPGTIIWEGVIIWMWTVLSWRIDPYSIIVWGKTRCIGTRDIDKYNLLKKNNKIYLKSKWEWKI